MADAQTTKTTSLVLSDMGRLPEADPVDTEEVVVVVTTVPFSSTRVTEMGRGFKRYRAVESLKRKWSSMWT